MPIKFKQFLRPNGRTRDMFIDRPVNVEEKALALISRGIAFEIEELVTGEIYIEAVDVDGEMIANQLCENGPAIAQAVDALISETAALITREDLVIR